MREAAPLAQRHRELLADQHARYARLWRTFNAWMRCAQSGSARKQMIDAACVVGARFVQRRFFQRWRERAAQHKAADIHTHNTPAIAVVVTNRSRAHKLRVVGAAIPRPAATATAARTAGQRNDQAVRASALRRLLDAREQRRLFKRWRSTAAALRRELEQKALVAAQVLCFQVRQALARWKRRAAAARERSQLEQRAHFFLYFCLAKRSLALLARHAASRKRIHAAVAIAARGAKRRALRQMLALYEQRRRLRVICAAWRVHAAARKHASDPTIASARLVVGTQCRSRLLREAFAKWRDALVRKQVLACLARAARQLQARATRLAWRRWQQLVVQAVTVERWQDARHVHVQRRIWDAWRQQAVRAGEKERDRRRAVRFAYRRSLRTVFDAFLAAALQSRAAAESAAELAGVRAKRALARCFQEWAAVALRRRDAARLCVEADRLRARALARRAWTRGWRSYVASRATSRASAELAARHFWLQLQRRAFAAWRGAWVEQRTRSAELEATAARHLAARSKDRAARVLRVWLEYARRRQAQRIVSAHVRGEWQLKQLRQRFSDWQAGVSESRWQQLQSRRAQQQHTAKLTQRCFAFWKAKVAALRQLREQNRAALVHWKLTVERKAFEGLKAYVARKRAQRTRMHDALEFRHRLIVRDGVRHWMAAALHLQSQREQLVSQSQADRAARIWRTLDHQPPHVGRYRSPPARAIGKENRGAGNALRPSHPVTRAAAATRLGLAEFVTHPAMNRPPPRRPIDLLLGDACTGLQHHPSPTPPPDAEGGFSAVASDLHARYGFAFPAEPFAPLELAAPPRLDAHPLDALEKQLRRWMARKQHLKTLHDQIRARRHQLAVQRDTHPSEQAELLEMEQQHAVLSSRWLVSKEQIRAISHEILRLHAALQSAA